MGTYALPRHFEARPEEDIMATLSPTFEAFEAAWQRGENQLVFARLAADLDTPVSLMMKLTDAATNTFMLESVTGGEVRGRYSIIGMKPDLIWECRGTSARINRQARFDNSFTDLPGDPLTEMRKLIAESRIEMPEDLPAASAGLFGYLGYDMIRLVEHLPNVNPDTLGVPDAMLMRPSVVAVLDGVKGEVTLCAPAWAASGVSARAAYAQAAERVMDALRDLDRQPPQTRDLGDVSPVGAPVSNFSKEAYLAAVEKAKDYIRAGDIFQCVPSQRWVQDFPLPPFALYRSLRRTNPSPFMFFLNFGGFQIVGASPEILVRLREGEVTIRPIAGTRKRGATPEEDRALEADLLSDQKELAEHLMLLDLGRNDVGRVSKVGTVHPTEKFIIERYSHVMHIVSNVVGEISEGEDALSALLAGLPAGTVSGAPKVRAMEIIDELEPEKRGVYGGGVGYFAANGEMDMCIALRTAVLKDAKIYVQSGGGVVFDSDPESEFEETVNKAMAMMKAAEGAGMFARRGNL
jgi:anthranilate synthase component I